MPRLTFTRAPFLPLAPVEYNKAQQDQFANALRLYFNQVDSNGAALLGPRGGQYLNFPYGSAYETTNQTAALSNTAYALILNAAGPCNGVTVDGTNGMVVPIPGVYNYAFSLQFRNTDSNFHAAHVWLKINGVNAPWTASYASVPSKHGSTDGTTIMAANFLLELQAGDRIDLWWSTEDTTVSIWAVPATGTAPGSPSVAASLTYVSSLSTPA